MSGCYDILPISLTFKKHFVKKYCVELRPSVASFSVKNLNSKIDFGYFNEIFNNYYF
jgi:hypothetical protein